ncbi:MAG TPA: iron-sulfur cluster assembly scaffold protein, partial [Burkholderiales bacterium]|nr:iron-sulfur cluster assembly scaffold protein [Burkholderiales bacterium]
MIYIKATAVCIAEHGDHCGAVLLRVVMDAYDDLIMDHIKHARNYRVLEEANCMGEGSNPLCGDEIVLYIRIEDGYIADAAFQCSCCGISMASASIMTELARGGTVREAKT